MLWVQVKVTLLHLANSQLVIYLASYSIHPSKHLAHLKPVLLLASWAVPLSFLTLNSDYRRGSQLTVEMASYLWRKYADYLYTKWEKTFLWDMVAPYRRPKSFTPLVTIYVAAFYTGVIGAAITEQLYKEKYWEEHPGKAVPLMEPKFYWGPWRVMRGEVPRHE